MAIVVNQVNAAAPGGGPATFVVPYASGGPTAGRMMVLCTGAPGDGVISTVTDNQTGNTWVRGPHATDSGASGFHAMAELWYLPSVLYQSGTYTVTATPSIPGSGANPGSFILEVSGLAGTLDKSNAASDVAAGNTQLTVTASGANSSADSLVVGFIVKPAAAVDFASGPSGYTAAGVYVGTDVGISSTGGYKIVSALETSSMVSPTWSVANYAAGVIATFGAPSVPVGRGPMPRQIYVMP